jgi:hypothetical protein
MPEMVLLLHFFTVACDAGRGKSASLGESAMDDRNNKK